ncbi:MAG: hypothetical protein GY847_07135, partial [Proteobacteria bacterium]|nr:hypothetical protein [Pseudomonadota bacterium]
DTETLGTKWFGDNISQIEIGDLETGVTRQITELPSVYWGTAIEGKYLAWAAGQSLWLCDLEKGGYIDADGHVIPATPDTDAGTDAGKDGGK